MRVHTINFCINNCSMAIPQISPCQASKIMIENKIFVVGSISVDKDN